jgi:hypothetical protein
MVGNGGDQSYGSSSATGYPAWTTAASGTAARNAVLHIGNFDLWIAAGSFEGWDNGGNRDRENLSQALLKNATYSNPVNNSRPTLMFPYANMNESAPTGGPSQTFTNLVAANNWWLYESAGGAGTITPSAFGGGNQLINFACAWPAAIGAAGLDASICGSIYGTTSTGPTGAQGPARAHASYQASKLFTKTITDARFTGKFGAGMAAPSSAGVFMDNIFANLNGGGNVAASFLDGIHSFSGSNTASFPAFGASYAVMARGMQHFFGTLQSTLATLNPGNTYYNFGNITQYGDNYDLGAGVMTIGLENTMHGGLLESVIGVGASSWEFWQTGGGSAWNSLRKNYYQAMDFCIAPKMVCLGTRLPAIDGSQVASWAVSGTLTNVATNTALEYQLMRMALCTTLLDDGYFGASVNGYDPMLTRWYDEYGDDSLTQVNVKRGYLGMPLTVRPTAAWNAGVWRRDFDNGTILVNPRGNGSQTVALGATFTKLSGTQQPLINSGASVSSVTLLDGDGIILRH